MSYTDTSGIFFSSGSKVMCVDDRHAETLLTAGETYTVSAHRNAHGMICLAEIGDWPFFLFRFQAVGTP